MSISTNHNNNQLALKTAIKEVYANICSAFAEQDIDSALSFFADREDMVKISNGLLFQGKKHLARNWHERFDGESGLCIRIENVEVHRIDDKHAWATADEYISLGEQNHKAIVSNIFILDSSGWKILLDHTTYIQPEIAGSE